jgi:tRNA dimethylallyltransferase
VIPILCGGTGLYIDSILFDMDYPDTPPDWSYREELEEIRKNKGNKVIWNMLAEVDPEYASELSPENYRYVMRGLEVLRATGKSKRESQNTKTPRFSPLFLTPYTDNPANRKILYEENINTRVKNMFSS